MIFIAWKDEKPAKVHRLFYPQVAVVLTVEHNQRIGAMPAILGLFQIRTIVVRWYDIRESKILGIHDASWSGEKRTLQASTLSGTPVD